VEQLHRNWGFKVSEKKSSRKRILVIIGVIVMVGIIVLAVVCSQYQPAASPCVEVKYTTVAWYHTYPSSDNKACLVLNLTITNKGYTDGVIVLAYFGDFSLNVSNVAYNPSIGVSIPNSSELLGYTYLSPTLKSVTLLNNGTETGTIMFEVPKEQYNQPFTLQCSMTTTKYATVSVQTSGS
jgi:hypothetical protein